MSKIGTEKVRGVVEQMLAYSGGKTVDPPIHSKTRGEITQGVKRKFQETIEMQVGLKDYDPSKDKRFNGTIRLKYCPRPNLKICVLGNANHCEIADSKNVPRMDVEALKAFNKNKKLVKKFAAKYTGFLASDTMIKQIPRLLGPGLNKAGKFPTLLAAADSMDSKLDEMKSNVKFQLKKVLGLGVAVAHTGMSEDQIVQNVMMSANFLAGLLKKGWQNIGSLHVKSTMGPAIRLY